jgi:hypothetical protein
MAVVEQQRLVGVDQELVEGEAVRPDLRHQGRKAIDLVGDFSDFGFHAPKGEPSAPSAQLPPIT